MPTRRAPTLALVGDRSPHVAAHERIPTILAALADGRHGPIDLRWLHSSSIATTTELGGFDGIWVLPGSPYQHADGVVHAINVARTHGIPFLGTCAGFQHMLLELARNACGLDVVHGETGGAAAHLLVPLTCSLLGEEDRVTVRAGTLAARIMGAGPSIERYFCAYGLDEDHLPTLEAHGLVVSGVDDHGAVRLAERVDHPFFLGSLFQPELASSATWVHPIIRAFVAAVRGDEGGYEAGRSSVGGRASAAITSPQRQRT